MKKNKMMRLASLLLVCVLLTTSVIGGTFAKYTTSADVEDKARVAYWGFVESTADASLELNLFSTTYDAVASSNADKVLAPGTTQEETFKFEYTPNNNPQALTATAITAPEVNYTFAVNAEVSGDYTPLDNNENFYWTVKAPGATEATKCANVTALITAIEALAGDGATTTEGVASKVYTAGTKPAIASGDCTIGWVWEFEKDADATPDGFVDEDAADTAMGNATNLSDITIKITITATQVDA